MVSPMNSRRSGCARAGGIEVDDAAADAELAGLVDGILARVAGGDQQIAEIDGRDLLAGRQRQRHARPAASGGLTRGSSAAAEATINGGRVRSRERVQRPRARRGDVEVRREPAVRDRPRATGNGRTTRSTSASGQAFERGEEEARVLASSARRRRRSARRAAVLPRAAEAAAYMAFAAGVSPLTRAAGAPAPRRLAAVFSSARSVSELEV